VSEELLPWRAYRTVLWLAVSGAAYAAAIVGWLWLPGYRPVPTPVWLAAVMPAVMVNGSAVLFARRYWRRGSTQDRTRPTERVRPNPIVVVRALLAVLVTLIVVVLVLTARARAGPPLPPGQPEIVNGQYMLNNHGSLTPVSRELYLRAGEGLQQLGVSVAMVFYLVAGLTVGVTAERLTATARPSPSGRG
jgi:lysylphosphatidylglycerol synthetase-like protein (DUF2156 family)